jgi:hypothetical protein
MEPVYLPPPISKPVHDIEMEKAIKGVTTWEWFAFPDSG